jgi:hypothetical protein
MTIKATEVGKQFNYGTFYDLSGASELTLKFTSPSGTVSTFTQTGGRVTAPATDVVDSNLGVIPGNTYMQLVTQATDFTEVGTYTVCGTYEDSTPIKYFGDDATFEVEEAC